MLVLKAQMVELTSAAGWLQGILLCSEELSSCSFPLHFLMIQPHRKNPRLILHFMLADGNAAYSIKKALMGTASMYVREFFYMCLGVFSYVIFFSVVGMLSSKWH